MSKNKAIICTILLLVAIVTILIVSKFIRNEEYGISLHDIIMNGITYLWISEFLEKFYEWLNKVNT